MKSDDENSNASSDPLMVNVSSQSSSPDQGEGEGELVPMSTAAAAAGGTSDNATTSGNIVPASTTTASTSIETSSTAVAVASSNKDEENSSNASSDPLMVKVVSPPSSDDKGGGEPLLVPMSSTGDSTTCAKHPPASTTTTTSIETKTSVVVASNNNINNRSTMTTMAASLVDRLLQRYVTYMSSSLHQDRGLKFLQWTLWLLSRLVLVQNKNTTTTSRSTTMQKYSRNLRKLYLDLSFVRYATRLLGLPAALEAARSGSWTPSSYSCSLAKEEGTNNNKSLVLMKWIGRVLAWSMVVYYPTEHMAYAQWMLPNSFPPQKRTAERWSYISCRAWLVYLLAETTQCVVQWRQLVNTKANEDADDDDDKESKRNRQVALRKTKVLLTRDLLFLLPCINWSLPNWDVDPWLPETLVNTLMWLESVVCLTQ